MAILMALLLVAFLVPTSIQSCQSREHERSQVLGEAFGKPLTTGDILRANDDMNILRMVGVFVPQNLSGLEFHLIMEESRRMGIRVSQSELQTVELDARGLAEARARYRRSLESIRGLVARYMAAMYRSNGLNGEAVTATTPRVERAYRDQTQEVVCKLSIIDAKALADTIGVPTEEEIQEEFEAGKNRTTTINEDGHQFGYRLGNRVQIEYLTIDPAKVQDSIHVKESEAKEYYAAHRSQYTRSVPKVAATQSTQPAAPEYETIELSYEEAKEQVKRDRRQWKAVEEGQRVMSDLARAAREPWLNATPGPDNYLVPPAHAGELSFEGLRDRFSKTLPVEYVRTELLDREGLERLPGIGRSFIRVGQSGMMFADLALNVKGLGSTSRGDPVRGLNVLEPSEMLSIMRQRPGGRSEAYQSFVMRVLKYEPAGPPALDAVREAVIKNVRTRKAFEAAGEHARKLHARAQEAGIEAAAGEMVELRGLLSAADAAATTQPTAALTAMKYLEAFGPSVPKEKMTRQSAFLRGAGNALKLAKALFDASEATTQAAHRVVLVSSPSNEKWFVAELVEVKPLYEGEFADRRAALENRERQMIQGQLANDWFDPEKIYVRTGFKPAPGREGLIERNGRP